MRDFKSAVDQEYRRMVAGWHHLWHYTEMSRYSRSVEALVKTLGRSHVGVWWYDELVADPGRVVAEVHDFLGLSRIEETAHTPATARVNVSGQPRNRFAAASFAALYRAPAARRLVKRALPFSWR